MSPFIQSVFKTLQVTEQSAVVQAGTPETLTDFVTKILVLHLHVVFRRSVKIKKGRQFILFFTTACWNRSLVLKLLKILVTIWKHFYSTIAYPYC